MHVAFANLLFEIIMVAGGVIIAYVVFA